MADLNRNERLKAIHDDKVSSCLKVFTCCLGPDCHTVIKPEMKNLEFRKALHKLDKHYGVVVGGQSGLRNLRNKITTSKFNPNRESVWSHISEVKTIAEQMAKFDETSNFGEKFVLGHVLESVIGSGEKEFVEACKWVEMWLERPWENSRPDFNKLKWTGIFIISKKV